MQEDTEKQQVTNPAVESTARPEERESMSDTPKLPDECKKLLDNGWRIQLFRNTLGSYTARATSGGGKFGPVRKETTDDFEPSQALYRITEKVLGRIV
jgi:hypothetical protein